MHVLLQKPFAPAEVGQGEAFGGRADVQTLHQQGAALLLQEGDVVLVRRDEEVIDVVLVGVERVGVDELEQLLGRCDGKVVDHDPPGPALDESGLRQHGLENLVLLLCRTSSEPSSS